MPTEMDGTYGFDGGPFSTMSVNKYCECTDQREISLLTDEESEEDSTGKLAFEQPLKISLVSKGKV